MKNAALILVGVFCLGVIFFLFRRTDPTAPRVAESGPLPSVAPAAPAPTAPRAAEASAAPSPTAALLKATYEFDETTRALRGLLDRLPEDSPEKRAMLTELADLLARTRRFDGDRPDKSKN